MHRILVLFAHPALEKSRANRSLIAAVRDLPGVTFHDLYETYPEFDIDVRREQSLLVEHDVIVLQHPFFWYSTPALLKEWQDLVLEHGWAYGSEGKMLEGKRALSVVTTGGREPAYEPDGHNRFTMRQFLAPIEQTFRLCGVEYLPPFVVHGTHGMTSEEIRSHADDYRRLLEALREGRVAADDLDDFPRINWKLDEVLTDEGEEL
ncbi:MAG: NAD(P)H-dependent oxidoreductase [Thermoanaerobaculia bacterium]